MKLSKFQRKELREQFVLSDECFERCRNLGDQIREIDGELAQLGRRERVLQTASDNRLQPFFMPGGVDQRSTKHDPAFDEIRREREDLLERRAELQRALDESFAAAQQLGRLRDALEAYCGVKGPALTPITNMPMMGMRA